MLIAIAALLAGLGQAEPLDPDLACIAGRVSPASRAAIVAETTSGQRGPVHAELTRLAGECGRQRGWQADYQTGILRIAGALVVAEEAGAALTHAGIAPEQIERWYDAQSPEFRARGQVGPGDGERLVLQLIAEGASVQLVERHAQLIGAYVGALGVIEAMAAAGNR